MLHLKKLSLFILLISLSDFLMADEIRVASASNFSEALKIIARHFEKNSKHKVTIISGSTGKLYAQIKHGAPFDAFFSGDKKRAELLDKEKIAQEKSRFTYAIGKLILWSPKSNYIDKKGKVLQDKHYRYLAIANPKLAPYGKAAMEFLQHKNLWTQLQSRMVRGESIGQALQFVKSGNAELGLIAYSQIKRPGHSIEGSYWEIPDTLYTPIEQQAVLLNTKQSSQEFYDFVQTNEVQQIIKSFAYGIISDSKTELVPPSNSKLEDTHAQ